MGDTLGHTLRTASSFNLGSPCLQSPSTGDREAAASWRVASCLLAGQAEGPGCLLALQISLSFFHSGAYTRDLAAGLGRGMSPAH